MKQKPFVIKYQFGMWFTYHNDVMIDVAETLSEAMEIADDAITTYRRERAKTAAGWLE